MKLGTKVVDFGGEDPYTVAFNDGYDDYRPGVKTHNPYPPDSRANWGWEAGYGAAEHHHQTESAERAKRKSLEPRPLEIVLEDEEGVDYGTLTVQSHGGGLLVTLDCERVMVDSWTADLEQARAWATTLEQQAEQGCPMWFDLALEPDQARQLAQALRNTAACVSREWV